METEVKKSLAGFILIKEYPNCKLKLNQFEPLTDGSFLNFPEFWKPIYIDNETEFKTKSLKDIQKENFLINEKLGYNKIELPNDLYKLLLLINSEVSEIIELDRKNSMLFNLDEIIKFSEILNKYEKDSDFIMSFEKVVKDTLPDELADIVLRVLHFCSILNIDLETSLNLKMRYNKYRKAKRF